jgi:flavin-binding protein dodecin
MVEKTIDLTAQSSTSIEAAIKLAVSRAAVTITDIRQARVTDIVALIKDGEVANWRVDLRVTFRVSDRVHE